MRDFDYCAELRALIGEPEALLIVPPFAPLDRPSLGVHVLQACARQAGFSVSVFYANVLMARAIGVEEYNGLYDGRFSDTLRFIWDRLFARTAYGLPPLGNPTESSSDWGTLVGPVPIVKSFAKTATREFSLASLMQIEAMIPDWVDALAKAVVQLGVPIVGCTSFYDQTNASIALLKQLKRTCAQTVTIIGGPNCAGEMAEGIASVDPSAKWIDYIFSGESEGVFVDLLRGFASKSLSSDRIIHGQVCRDLDAIPLPDFQEYFGQLDRWLDTPRSQVGITHLVYETSRGCWWGEKHRCTFCGMNGPSIEFRQKSPEKVQSSLRKLEQSYPVDTVLLSDNIMPYQYFDGLLDSLGGTSSDLRVICSYRAPISLDQILKLREAGFLTVEVGIESVSSDLLRLMNKGVLARQNIALLRYARAVGIQLYWNILWGFPGDKLEMYQQMLDLLPMMYHLQPPNEIIHILISRFSLYFEQPEAYGLHNVRPMDGYATVLPKYADVDKIAAQFIADYECDSHRNLGVVVQIMDHVAAWWERWKSPDPPPVMLQVIEFGESYMLLDTRQLPGTQTAQVLTYEQASAALAPQPHAETDAVAWALESKVGVLLDGGYVPLATAKPELIQAFEEDSGDRGG
jgi:ribosomal peptide maturation radical SAM protein 1